MDQIKLETMQETDLSQVITIANEVNLGVWQIDDYKDELKRKDSYILVAKRWRTVIGFIVIRFILVDTKNKSVFSEADIINIGVLENCQRQGIGNLLLNGFLVNADKLRIKAVWLEVRESNVEAQNFYRSNGFVQVQRRKNFYKRPSEDALIMRLKIVIV